MDKKLSNNKKSNKEMVKESKKAISEVFKKFDKNNNGSIEQNELEQVAQELGISINVKEVIQIFDEVDINQDQKIQFEEFWEWWKRGRPNKLEKMVYTKLKALKFLKKVHSDFVRYGPSLEAKFEPQISRHYYAFNYGQSKGNLSFDFQLHINNQQAKDMKQILLKKLNYSQLDSVILLRLSIPHSHIKNAKSEFLGLFEDYTKIAKWKIGGKLIKYLYGIQISAVHTENSVYLIIQFDNERNSLASKYEQIKEIVEMLKLSEVSLKFNLQLKNGLKELMENQKQEFVKWLLCGFIIELTLDINKQYLEQTMKKNYELISSSSNSPILSIMSLLQQSKMHLAFKDIEDIDLLFKHLGLEELAKQTPSNEQMLQELKAQLIQNQLIKQGEDMKQNGQSETTTEKIMLQKFIELVTNHKIEDIQIISIFREFYLSLDLKIPGIVQLLQFCQNSEPSIK